MRVQLRNPDRVETVEGPATVAAVLERLAIAPHTVLVIRDGQLVTAGTELDDDSSIEVRPVISGGAGGPRCRDCGAGAVHEEPRHRAAWCARHYPDHVQRQVRRAIDREGMFGYADRLLVAVSGGKDSLALWDALLHMGYAADGLYVGLGIGGYSDRSGRVCRRFAEQRGAHLTTIDLADQHGYTIPAGARAAQRPTCGVCGLSKRYVFNRAAVEGGYDVLVTGHNLDDEAATLLGNLVRWQEEFLRRQRPVLPASGGNQVRKVKPLYRLSERETAAYCIVRGIDYVVEECPLVAGNSGHRLKQALDVLEDGAPGTKAQFYFGFLERDELWPAGDGDGADGGGGVHLRACRDCGMPTPGEVCAFCRQRSRIVAALDQPA